MQKTSILNVNIDRVTYEQAIREIAMFLVNKKQNFVVTPNPEFLMAAQKDEEFKEILNAADLAIPDGVGLLWAATMNELRIMNYELRMRRKIQLYLKALWVGIMLVLYPKYCQKIIPERVAGADLVWEIARLAEQKKCSVYLLGAGDGVAMGVAVKLLKKYPNLKIAGAEEGITNYELRITNKETDENRKLIARINRTKPDILLVAFGQVKQEKWIWHNLAKIPSVKVAMGVGGTFDFIVGQARRAPLRMRKSGLEWFWRVVFQPWRLGRIFTATWKFGRAVINATIKK